MNWAAPNRAIVICATRPLPRLDSPLIEAREALHYVVYALDDVRKAKETAIGFGILNRRTGCLLYITPCAVRESKVYGTIIPIVYRVHKPPLVFILPILARVTSNAFQAILSILAYNVVVKCARLRIWLLIITWNVANAVVIHGDILIHDSDDIAIARTDKQTFWVHSFWAHITGRKENRSYSAWFEFWVKQIITICRTILCLISWVLILAA